MNYEKGKSFVANPRLLKADTALYFPNLHGNTLVPGSNGVDTTPLLKNKISIVAVFSCVWAERQVQSFLDATKNPELHKAVQSNLSTIQFVNISFEDNLMKSFLVRLFTYRLRRQTAEEDWRRYFFINKGMSDEMLEAMGVMNRKVGYVYLVDRNCRIRWAGSGDATGDELRYMVEGLKKLLDESRSLPKVRYIPKKPLPPTELYDTLVS